MKTPIYADNAATTKLDPAALEAMMPWLCEEYGNASQPYSFARKPKKALAEARALIADCIHASPEEIFFTSGGTESDNWAIKGSALAQPDKGPIVTTAIEHHAVLHACAALERAGWPVIYLQPDSRGVISVDALETLPPAPQLVSVMYSNNEIGTLEPIRALAEAAHRRGARFHTDAVQAVGHVPVDAAELGVDLLSASAHKFNGPKGIGFLYVRKGTGLARFHDGGAQEFGMRAGTENVAAIVGMAKALEINCRSMAENEQRIARAEQVLMDKLKAAGLDFRRNGADRRVPGNISLSFRNAGGEALLHRLDLMGICVSTGSACDSVNTQISHVLRAIRLDEADARGTIRISLGRDNTVEEAGRIADALIRILGK